VINGRDDCGRQWYRKRTRGACHPRTLKTGEQSVYPGELWAFSLIPAVLPALAREPGEHVSGSGAVLTTQGCQCGKEEARVRGEIVSFLCGRL
jgi:hypothetical protein